MGFASDAPRFYAETAQRLAVALGPLTAEDWQTVVPACPRWSVADVMAHVSGLVAETLAGVPLPRGSDEATARQVRDRSTMAPEAIVDEWRSNAPAFAAFAEGDPAYVAALTSDLVVHASDIAEAIGIEIDLDPVVVLSVAVRYAEMLQRRCHERIDTALTIEFTDGPTLIAVSSEKTNELQLIVPAAEFLRCVTGRRSRSEVEQLAWSADPTAVLAEAWSQYGLPSLD